VSVSFQDWYKDPRWQKKRLEILQRDGWTCVGCGDTKNTLHVHHLSYNGPPWCVADDQLQALCQECHSALGEHPKAGVSWLTPSVEGNPIYGDSTVLVEHCPYCGGKVFKDKGSYAKCMSEPCSFNTSKYLDCGGVTFSQNIEWLNPSGRTPLTSGKPTLFRREIGRVYLAGKMSTSWRDQIVGNGGDGDWFSTDGVCGDSEIFRDDGSWGVMRGYVPTPFGQSIDYCGPYWNASIDPCGGHGDAGITAMEFPNSHASGSSWNQRMATSARCRRAINKCDLLFAWIDSMDAYGTLVEIGIATRCSCIIVVAFDKSKTTDDLWFAASVANLLLIEDSPMSAWDKMWSLYKDSDPTFRDVASALRHYAVPSTQLTG
jgi:hypothetical protein